VSDPFARAGSVIKSAAALVALLPGIAALLGLVQIPPSIGNLVAFITVFVGLSCVMATAMLTNQIRRTRGRTMAIIVMVLALAGASLATAYYLCANRFIVAMPEPEPATGRLVVIPLNPERELRDLVAVYDDDYQEALATSSQRQTIARLMDRESAGTTILLVVLLVCAQALSTSAVVIGAWKVATRPRS
jgi:hypothetical protein